MRFLISLFYLKPSNYNPIVNCAISYPELIRKITDCNTLIFETHGNYDLIIYCAKVLKLLFSILTGCILISYFQWNKKVVCTTIQ